MEILELIIEVIADEITRDKEATSTNLKDLRKKQENIGSNPLTRFDPVKDKDEIDENKSNEMPYKPIADLPRTGISQRNQREFQNNRNITISASGVKRDNYPNQPITSTPRVGQYNQKSSNISISASGVKKNESQKTSSYKVNYNNPQKISISASGVKKDTSFDRKGDLDIRKEIIKEIKKEKPIIEEKKIIEPKIIEEKIEIKEEPIVTPIVEDVKIEEEIATSSFEKVIVEEPIITDIKEEPKEEIKGDAPKDEYDERGFNRLGYHKNGTRRDNEGYDFEGYSIFGYDKDGYNKEGYNRLGYNRQGFDSEGYDVDGYNKDGFNRFGGKRNK